MGHSAAPQLPMADAQPWLRAQELVLQEVVWHPRVLAVDGFWLVVVEARRLATFVLFVDLPVGLGVEHTAPVGAVTLGAVIALARGDRTLTINVSTAELQS